MSGQGRLPGSSRPGDQHAAAAEVALASEHGVQRGNTSGDALVGCRCSSSSEVTGSTEIPSLLDEKRKLVGAVRRSPVFHDAHAPREDGFRHPVIEQDDAVGNVFFQAVAGQVPSPRSAVMTAVRLSVLQPPEHAPEFAAQNRFVGEAREQRFHAVEHHPLRADGIDGQGQPDEQSFQVVFAGLLDQAALDEDVVDGQLLCAMSPSTSKPSEATLRASSSAVSSNEMQTPGSSNSVAPRTRNSMPSRVFPQPGAPADQGGPSFRQAAESDLIQTMDAGRAFGECAGRRIRLVRLLHRRPKIGPGGLFEFNTGRKWLCGAVQPGGGVPSPRKPLAYGRLLTGSVSTL